MIFHSRITRRNSGSLAALVVAAALALTACGGAGDPGGGGTGKVTPTESFEKVIGPLMTKWSIPGGAVALVRNEKLVMAEGYGLADKTAGTAAAPESLFRIASLSKPLTAVAVLRLVETGMLGLDDKAFTILGDLEPPSGATV